MKLPIRHGVCVLFAAMLFPSVAADLPTVTVEHLYYLSSRGERVRKFNSSQMIEYCLALKLGGKAFDDLHSQLVTIELDLSKMLRIDEIPQTDQRVVKLKKNRDEIANALALEAQKIQEGLVREALVANDTMTAIVRAQIQR